MAQLNFEQKRPTIAAMQNIIVPDRHAPLGRIGTLEVRLASDEREIHAAQKIRYRIFHDELGAKFSSTLRDEERDADRFDDFCDHLLVFDTSLPGPADRQIVGTYRVLKQEDSVAAGGFYTQNEFDLQPLISRHEELRFLELGRSCVLPEYRSKRTVELLWQGIWSYVRINRIDVMTGCASFAGTVPAAHAEALSFLAHNCTAKDEWAARALDSLYYPMDLMPLEAINSRNALAGIPPLIKGYLRLGAKIGEGCVIDHDFGTTDVLIVLPVSEISERYISYYGGNTPYASVS